MPGTLENPLPLPAIDREVIWNQTVDAVDDYFRRIQRKERVRLIGGILTEGRIDTHPLVGSTLLNLGGAVTPGYEKWLATLQSIRRKATVRLIPARIVVICWMWWCRRSWKTSINPKKLTRRRSHAAA